MKTVDYKIPEGFEGKILLKVPKYTERLKIVKDCNFDLGSDGEAQVTSDQLDSIISLVEGTQKYVAEVNLKHVASGDIANSFEDLEYNPVFDSLVVEVCSAVLNAGQVGNS